jgi:hypothetical protein
MGNRPPSQAQIQQAELMKVVHYLRRLGCTDNTIRNVTKRHAIRNLAVLRASSRQDLLAIGLPLGAVNRMAGQLAGAAEQQFPGNPNHTAVPVASAVPVAGAPLLGDNLYDVQPRRGWSPAKKKMVAVLLVVLVVVILIIHASSQ